MKIIATDYDGTLNHNGIDEKKKNAISLWRKKGNLFGVVSGRGVKSLLDVIKDKAFEYDFLIANNGAVICDKDLNILTETTCNGDIIKPFIIDLFSWGCPFVNVDSAESYMTKADTIDIKKGDYILETLPEITLFNQMNTMLENEKEAEKIVIKIEEKYKNILTPLQNGRCIDIVPFGVNKANGIYELLKVVGGNYEDVITVGDNINDYHMIKEFRSYAMENGVDKIKTLANYITLGITELIEKELMTKMPEDSQNNI